MSNDEEAYGTEDEQEQDVDQNEVENEAEEENADEEGVGEHEEGEEEADGEENEDLDKPPDLPINEDIMAESLLLLAKTGNGLSHAYVRLDAAQKGITDISLLKNYIHLRYIDLSNNNLKDISALNSLTHLLTLKVDSNKLTSVKLDPLPYLQIASFSENEIKTTEGICHPKLESLNLNKNKLTEIKGFDTDKLPSLQTLELRGNRLTSTKGIRLANLKNLFLAANEITRLEDFDQLRSLLALHLRDNSKLENLDGFDEKMLSLQYLNLRGTLVSDFSEVKKLNVLPKLRALVLLDTPLAENNDYRLEVLVAVRRLERLDKDDYLEEERAEAEEIGEQRKQKEIEDANILASTSQVNENEDGSIIDGDKFDNQGENED